MQSRYGTLTVYSWSLAVAAAMWLAVELPEVSAFPPWWAAVLCIAACLFVFQFGVPAPRVGLISMERVPQIAMLLILGPALAAAICALASLLWPLVNRRYSQNSSRVAMLRGLHNAGMTALMMLSAGYVYTATGGEMPIESLSARSIGPLLVMAVVAQAVNISLMTLFFKFDGRDVGQIITPSYALADFIFVPAGVLAALLYNEMSMPIFVLFVVLMVVFVLSFSRIGQSAGVAQAATNPLSRVFQTRRVLHGARTLDELGDRVANETRSLFRFDEFQLLLVDESRRSLVVRSRSQGKDGRPTRTEPLGGIVKNALERKEAVLISAWANAPSAWQECASENDKKSGSILMVPLIEGEEAVGLLRLDHHRPAIYSDADLHLLERLAEEVAIAVVDARAFEDADEYRIRLEQRVAERTDELEKANAEKERLITALRERSLALERESREDPLTGVANRRHFMQRLAAEFEVSSVISQPLTLAIADLDHFKDVNDLLGHRIGDEVLKQCALIMSGLCKETDVIARIGGEEFALILPGSACDAAIRLCENVRRSIEANDWRRVHPDLRLTISIGLWQWDGKATVSELLHAADTQLYEAKRGGRNRVA